MEEKSIRDIQAQALWAIFVAAGIAMLEKKEKSTDI